MKNKIKIEDKYYTVEEIKEALKLRQNKIYRPGTFFDEEDGGRYILTGFFMNGNEYAMLVNINDGGRWGDPIEVEDFLEVTQEELNKLTEDGDFELVEK